MNPSLTPLKGTARWEMQSRRFDIGSRRHAVAAVARAESEVIGRAGSEARQSHSLQIGDGNGTPAPIRDAHAHLPARELDRCRSPRSIADVSDRVEEVAAGRDR